MIGEYLRQNIDHVLNAVAPEAREEDGEQQAIRRALLAQADVLDPEGAVEAVSA